MSCNGSRAVDILKCWLFKKKQISSPDQWELRRHAFLRCTNWGGRGGGGGWLRVKVRNSLIPDLTRASLSGETRACFIRCFCLVSPSNLYDFALWAAQRAQRSARAAVIPRNVFCGREESDEYLLRAIRRRRQQRPGAVKRLRTAFSQWSNETNPSDKQLWKLNLFLAERNYFFSPRTEALSLSPFFFLNNKKTFWICHMALENSITTKNGDYHVALCGLAASLKIFM